MRGQVVLAVFVLGPAPPATAQSPPTAEQMIETAREAYSVGGDGPEAEPCPEATADEIVVCRQYRDLEESMRVASPTERAHAAGEAPPDPIPAAPYVLGLPECNIEVACHRIGRALPPIYLIDLEAIPEPLSSEEAALVFRAEDVPIPAEASPAAAP